jgi:hypothetical protein
VLAVPDANAFAGLESTLLTPRPAAAVVEAAPLAREALNTTERVKGALREIWPAKAAGDLLRVSLEQGEAGALKIRIVHWGEPLSAGAREALEKSLSATLEGSILLESVAITSEPITRQDGDLIFIARVAAAARVASSVDAVGLCLTRPGAGEAKVALAAEDKRLASALDSVLRTQPGLTTVAGASFQLRMTRGACAKSETSTADVEEAAPAAPKPGR